MTHMGGLSGADMGGRYRSSLAAERARSRTYAGHGDVPLDDRPYARDYDRALGGAGGMGGMGGMAPAMAMRGAGMRRANEPMEIGDSDIESVVSGTSAFSSQSAPHARARRMG